MIIGIGTDIVYIPRLEALYRKYGKKLIKKILTEREQEKIKLLSSMQLYKYLAKRFAAKEALVKAVGTGFSNNITLSDISVLNNEMGKPYYEISDKLARYIQQLSGGDRVSLHLSLSDDYPMVSAFALLEK